jgi:hypothetical protein
LDPYRTLAGPTTTGVAAETGCARTLNPRTRGHEGRDYLTPAREVKTSPDAPKIAGDVHLENARMPTGVPVGILSYPSA